MTTNPTTPSIAELLADFRMRVNILLHYENEVRNHGQHPDKRDEARLALEQMFADLEAQRDEALKDAERYHLVRTRIGWEPKWDSPFLPCGNTKIDPEETDRQIDAAIAQRGGNDA